MSASVIDSRMSSRRRKTRKVRHKRDPNELFEILGDKLWAVVRNDARPRFRVLLLRSLAEHPPKSSN